MRLVANAIQTLKGAARKPDPDAAAATWSVVATCSESRRLIEYFVAHHLSIGADHIYLFFDDPADGCAAYFKDVPRVTTFACDDAYWRRRAPNQDGRPVHCTRQVMNANYVARKLCHSDWLFHIDADEFIFPRSGSSIGQILAQTPQDFDAVSLPCTERMFAAAPSMDELSLDGLFKLKPDASLQFGTHLYGALGANFPYGFQGHTQGKCARRMSAPEGKIDIHFVRINRKGIPHYKIPETDAVLLHYFPLSFEDWQHKFERRVLDEDYFNSMSPRAQDSYGIYKEYVAQGQAGISELFEKLSILPPSSEIMKKFPYLFMNVSMGIDQKVREFVAPFVRAETFPDIGLKAPNPVPAGKKIFQIGMDQASARDLCAFLGKSGVSYVFYDDGKLADDLIRAQKASSIPLVKYDNYQFIGGFSKDGYDCFLDFDYLFKSFPEAVYILNTQPLDEWLRARLELNDGAYLAEWKTRLQTQDTQKVIARWKEDWDSHVRHIRAISSQGGMTLIEFAANTSKPRMLLEKLKALGVV